MAKKNERVFGDVDCNARPSQKSFSRSKLNSPVEGQENTAKRRKLDIPQINEENDDSGAQIVLGRKEARKCTRLQRPTRVTNDGSLIDRSDVVVLQDEGLLTSDMLDGLIKTEVDLERRLAMVKEARKVGEELNSVRRELLIEWFFQLKSCLKVESEVIHLAVTLVDVVFSSMSIPLEDVQTVGAAALWLSRKYFRGATKCNQRPKLLSFLTPNDQTKVLEIHNRLIDVLKAVSFNESFQKESFLYSRYSSSKYRRVSAILSKLANVC